jgi:hypothetical protein
MRLPKTFQPNRQKTLRTDCHGALQWDSSRRTNRKTHEGIYRRNVSVRAGERAPLFSPSGAASRSTTENISLVVILCHRKPLKPVRHDACTPICMTQDSRNIEERSRLLCDQAKKARRLAEDLCEHSRQLHIQSWAIQVKAGRILYGEEPAWNFEGAVMPHSLHQFL